MKILAFPFLHWHQTFCKRMHASPAPRMSSAPVIASAGQANWCREHALLMQDANERPFLQNEGGRNLPASRSAARRSGVRKRLGWCGSCMWTPGAPRCTHELSHAPMMCSQMPVTQPQRHSKRDAAPADSSESVPCSQHQRHHLAREELIKQTACCLACGIIRAENAQSHEDFGMASHHAPRWGG